MEGRGRRWEGSSCLDLSRVHLNFAQVAVLPLYPRIVILLSIVLYGSQRHLPNKSKHDHIWKNRSNAHFM
jgi:hypothetical protein